MGGVCSWPSPVPLILASWRGGEGKGQLPLLDLFLDLWFDWAPKVSAARHGAPLYLLPNPKGSSAHSKDQGLYPWLMRTTFRQNADSSSIKSQRQLRYHTSKIFTCPSVSFNRHCLLIPQNSHLIRIKSQCCLCREDTHLKKFVRSQNKRQDHIQLLNKKTSKEMPESCDNIGNNNRANNSYHSHLKKNKN